MTLDVLKAQKQWRSLLPRERTFLESYLVDQDEAKAALAAFNIKPEYAQQYARSVLGRAKVAAVVSLFFNDVLPDTRDTLEAELWQVVRESKSDAAKVAAANLLADLKRWKGKGASIAEGEQTEDIFKDIDE